VEGVALTEAIVTLVEEGRAIWRRGVEIESIASATGQIQLSRRLRGFDPKWSAAAWHWADRPQWASDCRATSTL